MGFKAFRDSKNASGEDLLTFTILLNDTGTITICFMQDSIAIFMVAIPVLTTVFDDRSTTMARSI